MRWPLIVLLVVVAGTAASQSADWTAASARESFAKRIVAEDVKPSQVSAPRFLYIYRDSLKRGIDSTYRVIENDGAQLCADLGCPNPYLGMESLNGPHEAWWLNTFATAADTARVSKIYATDGALSAALAAVAQRKAALIGTPVQAFAVYRPDLSRVPGWSAAGARFIVVTVRRDHRSAEGSAWMTADSMVYILRPARSYREAKLLRRGNSARIFAIRPSWSMPAPAWVAFSALQLPRASRSRIGSASRMMARSRAGSLRIASASAPTRRRRPSCKSRAPFGVALIRVTRASLGSGVRTTSWLSSSSSESAVRRRCRTSRANASTVVVGGRPSQRSPLR